MTLKTSVKIFRFVGIWDLVLTLPFALPYLNGVVINLLSVLHNWISPERPFPAFAGLHLFFVGLFGILAVLWAAVRIHRPDRFLAAYDTLGRFVVAAAMIFFSASGGSLVPSIFSVSEIGFGIVQLIVLLQVRKIENLDAY